MKPNPKYLKDGREISADEALDHRGILRDGVVVRIHMTSLDAAFDDKLRHTSTVEYNKAGRASHTFETAEDPDDEDETDDAAPALLSDGTTVASHRPHFGVVDRATLEKLDAIHVTLDAIEGDRWKTAHSSLPSSPVVASDAQGDAREAAYRAYDEEMEAAHRKGR
jgi:hypothetical protein